VGHPGVEILLVSYGKQELYSGSSGRQLRQMGSAALLANFGFLCDKRD
jgi:hypothetical protein